MRLTVAVTGKFTPEYQTRIISVMSEVDLCFSSKSTAWRKSVWSLLMCVVSSVQQPEQTHLIEDSIIQRQ